MNYLRFEILFPRYTDWYNESIEHGWPSFRDPEVVWENVRCIKYTGETVSVTGAHLGPGSVKTFGYQ